jgi:hypothetical protein
MVAVAPLTKRGRDDNDNPRLVRSLGHVTIRRQLPRRRAACPTAPIKRARRTLRMLNGARSILV